MANGTGRIETLFDGVLPSQTERVLSPAVATLNARSLVLFGTSTGGAFSVICFFTLEPATDSLFGLPTTPNFFAALATIEGPVLVYHPHPSTTVVFPSPAPPIPVLGPHFHCSALFLSGDSSSPLTLKVLLLEDSRFDAELLREALLAAFPHARLEVVRDEPEFAVSIATRTMDPGT